jgi:pimeloyl-ACP methyl ester carboxylesterase
MDYVTFASQMLGGVIAAFLVGALLRQLSLGPFGHVIVGLVGGSLGGLVLTEYLRLAPAGQPDGTISEPSAIVLQILSGGAGGAVLMILTGLIVGRCRR